MQDTLTAARFHFMARVLLFLKLPLIGSDSEQMSRVEMKQPCDEALAWPIEGLKSPIRILR